MNLVTLQTQCTLQTRNLVMEGVAKPCLRVLILYDWHFAGICWRVHDFVLGTGGEVERGVLTYIILYIIMYRLPVTSGFCKRFLWQIGARDPKECALPRQGALGERR